MKINRKVKIAGGILLTPIAALAIFGFGDIVFDPTSYATLGNIWGSDISLIAKATESIAQMEKIYSNGMQIYNLGYSMSRQLSSRQGMMSVGVEMTQLNTKNQTGETGDWDDAANGDTSKADSAWGKVARSIPKDVSFLNGVGSGNSGRMASLASYELAQSATTNCLQTRGNQSTARVLNTLARAMLKKYKYSDSDEDNTQMAQTNLANIGQAHMLDQQVTTNSQLACIAQQETVANKMKADELADSLQVAQGMAEAKKRQSWALDPDTTVDINNQIIP